MSTKTLAKIDDDSWRQQCRRQMQRPLLDCIKFGFDRSYTPALDDAPYRTFSSTAEYRSWRGQNLPELIGYQTQ
jgi:hypothetical protein